LRMAEETVTTRTGGKGDTGRGAKNSKPSGRTVGGVRDNETTYWYGGMGKRRRKKKTGSCKEGITKQTGGHGGTLRGKIVKTKQKT